MYQIKEGSLCAGFNLIELKRKKLIDFMATHGHLELMR